MYLLWRFRDVGGSACGAYLVGVRCGGLSQEKVGGEERVLLFLPDEAFFSRYHSAQGFLPCWWRVGTDTVLKGGRQYGAG